MEAGSVTPGNSNDSTERWIGRRGAVHLVESGHNAVHAVVERSLGGNLAEIITTTLDNCAGADQVEVLLIPTAETYTVVLHAAKADTNGEAISLPTEPVRGSISTLTEAAERLMPNLWGVETGDLWLGPLLNLRTVTHQAVTPSGEATISDSEPAIFHMHWWTRKHDRSPLVYQLLISPSDLDERLDLVLRAMELDKMPPHSKSRVGRSLEEPIESPIDAIGGNEISPAHTHATQIWDTATVDHPDTDGICHYPTLGNPEESDGDPPHRAIQALHVVSGSRKTQGLLTATTNDDHYSVLPCDLQLRASKDQLQTFLNIACFTHPLPSEGYSWSHSPVFDRDEIIREPTETDSRDVLSAPDADAWRRPIHTARPLDIIHSWLGLPPHTETPRLDKQIRGPHLKTAVDSLPDSVAVVDRSATPTDIPIGNPAGIVKAANFAVTTDQQLWILAVDAESAAWANEILRQPIKTLHNNSAEPYTLPYHWSISDDRIPLVDSTQSWGWRISPAGRWLFHFDGEIRGHGPLNAVDDPEDLQLPCYRRSDSGVAHITPNGYATGQATTIDDLDERLTAARVACIPAWPTFAGRVQILFVESVGLHDYWPAADWQTEYDIEQESFFEPAARKFIQTFTVERPAGAPPATHVWPWVQRYYVSQADFDVSRPTRGRFERHVDTRVHIKSDDTVVLPDRSWAVPPPQQQS